MGSTADSLYESQIRDLPEQDRLRLVELISHDLALGADGVSTRRSILGLRGLGAELWQGVDAQRHVDALRDEWDRRQ